MGFKFGLVSNLALASIWRASRDFAKASGEKTLESPCVLQPHA